MNLFIYIIALFSGGNLGFVPAFAWVFIILRWLGISAMSL